jgi:hypothetical protein
MHHLAKTNTTDEQRWATPTPMNGHMLLNDKT